MSTNQLLLIYCLLIVAASLVGGWIPIMVRLTHQRMQLALSLVAGFMFGVALLHMLPHALHDAPADTALHFVLLGVLAMFFLERFFSYHHHELPGEGHDHDHGHTHGHEHGPEHDHSHGPNLSWGGALIGMTLHSIIAGVALGASMAVGADANPAANGQGLAGMAVFLVIFLHKPLDSLTVITLTTSRGWSAGSRHMLNAAFALAVPLGAMGFLFGLDHIIEQSPMFVACALAFSAGTFLCISLSDLLPELHFHQHDRVKLSAALLIGLALAWGAAMAEHQTHGDHGEPRDAEAADHEHHDHDSAH